MKRQRLNLAIENIIAEERLSSHTDVITILIHTSQLSKGINIMHAVLNNTPNIMLLNEVFELFAIFILSGIFNQITETSVLHKYLHMREKVLRGEQICLDLVLTLL